VIAARVAIIGLVGTIVVATRPQQRHSIATEHGGLDTASQSLVSLGRELFFDTQLGAAGTRSCATCHSPGFAFAEPTPLSVGTSGVRLSRNSPTLLNIRYAPILMWDGRFRTLEEQALQPFEDAREMGSSVSFVVATVRSDAEYREKFQKEFRGPPTRERIAIALSAYERSLTAGPSAFDRYLYDRDTTALTLEQKRGFTVFMKANCILCHEFFHPAVHPLGGQEAHFTDFQFHNLGVGFTDDSMSDFGRYVVTKSKEDWGRFRTPTLRNVALTAPYMHDGSIPTLLEVVKFYNRGGIKNPNLDPGIRPLDLSAAEELDLVRFLEALTSKDAVSFRWSNR
jgi:cytochrome c peroxidase